MTSGPVRLLGPLPSPVFRFSPCTCRSPRPCGRGSWPRPPRFRTGDMHTGFRCWTPENRLRTRVHRPGSSCLPMHPTWSAFPTLISELDTEPMLSPVNTASLPSPTDQPTDSRLPVARYAFPDRGLSPLVSCQLILAHRVSICFLGGLPCGESAFDCCISKKGRNTRVRYSALRGLCGFIMRFAPLETQGRSQLRYSRIKCALLF